MNTLKLLLHQGYINPYSNCALMLLNINYSRTIIFRISDKRKIQKAEKMESQKRLIGSGSRKSVDTDAVSVLYLCTGYFYCNVFVEMCVSVGFRVAIKTKRYCFIDIEKVAIYYSGIFWHLKG